MLNLKEEVEEEIVEEDEEELVEEDEPPRRNLAASKA